MDVKLLWDLTGCQVLLKETTRLGVSTSPHSPQSAKQRLNAPQFHSQTRTEVTSLCSALPAQVQPATPSSPLATGHHHPHRQTSAAAGTPSCRIRFSNQLFSKLNLDRRVPPMGKEQRSKGRHKARSPESFWKCQGSSFQISLCHPRIGPTGQRNKRLLKLGRTTYPAPVSNDFLWHRVMLPASVTQPLRCGTALFMAKRSKPRIISKHLHHLVPLTKYRLKGFP